ncbi:sensor domain-containing diguanylate cyclase [Azohydromonas aeria]|uniref:sensor domain-containing diguanylate cyclase n=1 Tax=Azohydromonas aeria TaxID=2590212 RepID=UPI0012F9E58C|nr:sensor domain-containing diguanylate cyclase [Azohydromonas aeria]
MPILMRTAWSRLADVLIVAAIVLVALAALGALLYHGRRLELDQLESHRRLAVLEARHNAHLFGQTLSAVELSLRGLLQAEAEAEAGAGAGAHAGGAAAPAGTAAAAARGQRLHELLRNAPHLRSLSLLDRHGLVQASTSPANVGVRVDLAGWLPEADPDSAEPLLRLGRAHAGRDLAEGRALAADASIGADVGFVPVMLGGGPGGQVVVATLNVDFFLNRLMAREAGAGWAVDVLRWDGALLLSTREAAEPGWRQAGQALVQRWHDGAEAGDLVQTVPGRGAWITAWRGDRARPFAVVARVEQAAALADAREEARRRALVLVPLIALAALALLLGWRLLRRDALRRLHGQAEQAAGLARLLDALPASVLLFGADGRALALNQDWRDMASDAALPAGEPQALHYGALAGLYRPGDGEGTPALEAGIAAVLAGRDEAFEGAYEVATARGPRWFRVRVRPFLREDQRCALLLQHDITAARRSAEALRLNGRVFAINAEAILITDARNRIVSVNPAFTRITGYAAEEVLGRTPALLSSGQHDAAFYQAMWRELLAQGSWCGEIVNRHKSGELFTEWLTITVDRDAEGRPSHFVGVFQDITERKRHEAELQRLATTDELTGVLNRRAFLDEVERELARFQRHGHAGALLMLDLDHFKQVNDRHGHAAGDAVLVQVCAALRERLRRSDRIGRLGGEEFALLLPETPAEGAAVLAESLRREVAALEIGTPAGPLRVTASIGVAAFAASEADAAALLGRADRALYAAKALGRNRVARAGEGAVAG